MNGDQMMYLLRAMAVEKKFDTASWNWWAAGSGSGRRTFADFGKAR